MLSPSGGGQNAAGGQNSAGGRVSSIVCLLLVVRSKCRQFKLLRGNCAAVVCCKWIFVIDYCRLSSRSEANCDSEAHNLMIGIKMRDRRRGSRRGPWSLGQSSVDIPACETENRPDNDCLVARACSLLFQLVSDFNDSLRTVKYRETGKVAFDMSNWQSHNTLPQSGTPECRSINYVVSLTN